MKSFNRGIVMVVALVMAALGFMSCHSNNTKLTSIKVTPVDPVSVIGLQFEAIGEFSDMKTLNYTSEVIWSSSDPTVATISTIAGSIGRVTVLSTGTTTITAVEPYNHFTSYSVLAVPTPSTITLTISPENPVMHGGLSHQFTALATFGTPTPQTQTLVSSSSMTWETSDHDIATVSMHGLVTAVTTTMIQSVMITLTDTLFGTELSSSTTLTVTPTALKSILVTSPTLTWTMKQGDSMNLTAEGHFEDLSIIDMTTSVEWVSSHIGTAIVSNMTGSKGVVTAVEVGTVKIKATDPISKVTGTASVTVQ